jgi:hypothetical protein
VKNYLPKLSILLLLGFLLGVSACTAETYEDPPNDLSVSDLVGTWETRYGKDRIDIITIREDGMFQQFYENKKTNYRFTTNWDPLRLENLSNRSVYIHFEHGRYYSAGEEIAELDGMGNPCPKELPNCYFGTHPRAFFDPYSGIDVEMMNELVVTIRKKPNGEIIFHHMWTSSDGGFALIGGESEIFHRVNE